jgi:hypothetical protein
LYEQFAVNHSRSACGYDHAAIRLVSKRTNGAFNLVSMAERDGHQFHSD